MFRLIKIVFNAFIIVLAFIGFNAIGGEKYTEPIKNAIVQFIEERKTDITKKLGDFSTLDEEFQIENAMSIMGYKTILAEHKASGQKMLIVDSGKKPLLTKEDIQSKEVEKKLQNLAQKFKYQGTSVQEISVTGHGEMQVYGKKVPYAKFRAKVTKLPVSEIGGVIASVNTNDGNEKLALSFSDNKKYSQLITNEFFKEVKENK